MGTSAARRKRLVVLVSGSGSNLQAIIDACAVGRLPADVVAVVSNKPDVFAIFDVDRDQAISARNRILPELADSGTLIFSCHLDFPGLGRVVLRGRQLAWQPTLPGQP